MILMVSKDKSTVGIQESKLISADLRSSPASALGQRPSRDTRGSRRSQLQALSTPLEKSKVDDGMEEDHKEAEDKANDMAGNDEETKATVNATKAANSKAKKRRSGRRR